VDLLLPIVKLVHYPSQDEVNYLELSRENILYSKRYSVGHPSGSGQYHDDYHRSVNVEFNQIYRIEQGLINTSISMVPALSQDLKVPINDLFDFPFNVEHGNNR
jgi:hypothetical protein